MFDLFDCHNSYSKHTYNCYFNQFPHLNYKGNMYNSRKTIQPTNKKVTRKLRSFSPNHKLSSLIDNDSSLSTKSMNVTTTTIGGKNTCIIVKDDVSNATVSTQDSSILWSHLYVMMYFPQLKLPRHPPIRMMKILIVKKISNHQWLIMTTWLWKSTNEPMDKKEKKGKKSYDMAWCKEANKQLKRVLECNLNPISFSGMNKLTSLSNGFTGTNTWGGNGTRTKDGPILVLPSL